MFLYVNAYKCPFVLPIIFSFLFECISIDVFQKRNLFFNKRIVPISFLFGPFDPFFFFCIQCIGS